MLKLSAKYSVQDFFNTNTNAYIYNSKWTNEVILNASIIEIVKRENPETVIDLGAGNSQLLKLIYWVKTRIAVDISQKMLDQIDDSNIIKVLSDIHKLPYESQSFDFAFCRQVLQYCKLNDILIEVHRILKKNGKLLIIHITDFDTVPREWYEVWKSFKKIDNRKFLSAPDLKKGAFTTNLKLIEELNFIVNFSYSWQDFYQKYSTESETERKTIYDFFFHSPQYIKDIMNLSMDDIKISFNRNFTYLLFEK